MQPPEPGDAESDNATSLASRYGRRAPGGVPTAKILGAVVVAALLAWAVWAAIGQSGNGVGAVVRSYQVKSPHVVSVTVDITRATTDRVRCTVTAIATDHTQVGQRVVTMPAGASGTRSVTVAVRTEREATAADVGGCR